MPKNLEYLFMLILIATSLIFIIVGFVLIALSFKYQNPDYDHNVRLSLFSFFAFKKMFTPKGYRSYLFGVILISTGSLMSAAYWMFQ